MRLLRAHRAGSHALESVVITDIPSHCVIRKGMQRRVRVQGYHPGD